MNINSKKIIEIMKPALVEKKLNTVLKIFGIVSLWAIGLALPFVTGLYVDRLVTDANLDLILTFVVAFLVIYVVRTAIIGMRYVVDTTFNNLLWHRVETNPILHMFKSHFSKYQNEDAGELTGKLKFDGQTFAFLFSNTTSAFIEAITVVAVFVMLFFIDFYIAVIALVVSPIYLLFYIIFKKRLFAQGEIYAKDDALYQSRKNEQIYRMSFIRKHEVANETLARLEEAYHTRNRSEIKQNILSFGYRQSGGILGAFFHVAVIGFGGYRVISGELSIGMFTVISLYFNMIMGAFFELSNFGVNIQMAKVSTNRLNEIYENPQDLNGDKQLEHINELKLNNLSLVYGDNKVFSGLSYNFKAGKIYAICGENGSGKTSLLNCILGLYQDICTGEILFDSTPINEMDMRHMRRNRIAFVEQVPEFLNMSIQEFLKFGIEQTESIKKRRQELIETFGIEKLDLDSDVAESGSNFSGGEKQKISLARSLSKDCSIVILDEPTSALDTDSVEILANLLNQQKSNRITLVISHDSRILELCDEKWYIDK